MGIFDWLFGARPKSNEALPQNGEPKKVSQGIGRVRVSVVVDLAGIDVQSPLAEHLIAARIARREGDIADAREHYQRVAYGSDRLSQAQRDALTEEVSSLTRKDPLYIEGLALLRQQLSQTPGVLQADLTRGLEERGASALRYVLYYADQLGDLVRVKSGRSYRLYLPDQPIPPQPEKLRPRPKSPPGQGGERR